MLVEVQIELGESFSMERVEERLDGIEVVSDGVVIGRRLPWTLGELWACSYRRGSCEGCRLVKECQKRWDIYGE